MDQASCVEPIRFVYARCGHRRVGLPRVVSVDMPATGIRREDAFLPVREAEAGRA
jgi:hypothetical protein